MPSFVCHPASVVSKIQQRSDHTTIYVPTCMGALDISHIVKYNRSDLVRFATDRRYNDLAIATYAVILSLIVLVDVT